MIHVWGLTAVDGSLGFIKVDTFLMSIKSMNLLKEGFALWSRLLLCTLDVSSVN
jgi:hypothetical protein